MALPEMNDSQEYDHGPMGMATYRDNLDLIAVNFVCPNGAVQISPACNAGAEMNLECRPKVCFNPKRTARQ